MKNLSLILALTISLCSFEAVAAKRDSQAINFRPLMAKLQAKMNARRLHAQDTKTLKFFISPAQPKAGDAVTIFAEPLTSYTDSDMILDSTFDAQSVLLDHPAKTLWVFNAGIFSELKQHTFSAIVSLQDKSAVKQIADAVAVLDAAILDLNNQIAAATDPAVIAQLTAARDDKVAQKNELLAALASLKTPIATESFSFSITANDALSDYPKITSISPNIVNIGGGTAITYAGQNFGASPVLKIDGNLIAITNSTNTSIIANTPLLSAGLHNVEVSILSGGVVKNTILQNALYATSQIYADPNTLPTAVAQSLNASIAFGADAGVTAASSFDSFHKPLRYEWRFSAVPQGATEPVGGSPVSTAAEYHFTPSVPGTYALSLMAIQVGSPNLSSSPSYAVINVSSPANRAPTASAPAISVYSGQTLTSQIAVSDADFWQQHSFIITKQPTLGTTTVSGSGLVSYAASSVGGSDSIDVLVVDNGNPPLSALVHVAVTVILNHAPVPTASPASLTIATNGTLTTTVNGGDIDAGQIISFAITTPPTQGTATINPTSGQVTYTAGAAAGSDSLVVTATDNAPVPLSGSITIPITIVAGNQAPNTGTFSYSLRSQGLPVTVGIGVVGASDPDGTIIRYQFQMGDGTTEFAPNAGPNVGITTHNYVAYGTYNGTVLVKDNLGTISSAPFTINVVNTALPTAKFSLNKFSCAAPCTVSTDATASSGPNPITQYRWLWGDNTAEEVGAGFVTRSHTYNNAGTYKMRLRTRDANLANGEGFATVYIGVTAPATGSPPGSDFTALPNREVVTGTTINFDGARSFDPNPSGAITNYAWNFGDFNCPSCAASGQTASHAYTAPFNYIAILTGTNALGGTSAFSLEMINVITGHAPRANYTVNNLLVPGTITGVAPFTVTANSNLAFDYDGTITSRTWSWGDSTANSTGNIATHTYTTPGVYIMNLNVGDNDGNHVARGQLVTVTAAYDSAQPLKALDEDGGEANQDNKNNLATACGAGNGEACYYLGKIYQDEGNTFVYQQLLQKACALGFQQACSGF